MRSNLPSLITWKEALEAIKIIVFLGLIFLGAIAIAGEPGPNDTGGTLLSEDPPRVVVEPLPPIPVLKGGDENETSGGKSSAWFDNRCDPFHDEYEPSHHTCYNEEDERPSFDPPEPAPPEPEPPEEPEPVPPPTTLMPPPTMHGQD